MTVMRTIRRDFEEEYGEPGYSVNEFVSAVSHFGRGTTVETVRKYASKEDLIVDLRKIDIDLKKSKAKYLIPRSNLGTLMESMSVDTTVEKLIEELEFQRERASSNINRSRKRRANRHY
jgi:hypothetical protein